GGLAFELAPDFLAAKTLPFDLFGARALGHAQQDLRQSVLGGAAHLPALAALAGKEGVDVGLADLDLRVDFAFAHPGPQDLAADVLAEAGEAPAFALDPLAQLRRGQAVFLRDPRDRPVELLF